jgi:hypothetical protein
MNYTSRAYTRRVLDAIADGSLDQHTVLLALLNYMSEEDVQDMCETNEFFPESDEDDDEDDFNSVASRHHY